MVCVLSSLLVLYYVNGRAKNGRDEQALYAQVH